MTAVRPEPRNGHPSWCRKDASDSAIGRHLSREVRIGVRRNRGEAVAWLVSTGNGPTWVRLLVAHMASASVEITLEDAVQLRDGLTALLRQAGRQ